MEHTAHVEQQLVADGDPSDVEVAQECLTRLMEMQEQLRKAPQNTIREGNDLLRALEQVGVVNRWVWSTWGVVNRWVWSTCGCGLQV